MGINWHNIMSNLAAIVAFAYTVYPNMSGETIMASIHDGTIFVKGMNIAIIYFLYNYEGPLPTQQNVKIHYVTDTEVKP